MQHVDTATGFKLAVERHWSLLATSCWQGFLEHGRGIVIIESTRNIERCSYQTLATRPDVCAIVSPEVLSYNPVRSGIIGLPLSTGETIVLYMESPPDGQLIPPAAYHAAEPPGEQWKRFFESLHLNQAITFDNDARDSIVSLTWQGWENKKGIVVPDADPSWLRQSEKPPALLEHPARLVTEDPSLVFLIMLGPAWPGCFHVVVLTGGHPHPIAYLATAPHVAWSMQPGTDRLLLALNRPHSPEGCVHLPMDSFWIGDGSTLRPAQQVDTAGSSPECLFEPWKIADLQMDDSRIARAFLAAQRVQR